MTEGTRVIYHLEDQDTPYLIRLNVPAQRVTLADFKQVLNKQNVRFFFKSEDDDFGVVKEEISDDDVRLPCVNGRVVCWVVSSDTCQSEVQSVTTPTSLAPTERTGGIGHSRPPSFHALAASEHESSEVTQTSSSQNRREKYDQGEHLNGFIHPRTEQNGTGPGVTGDTPSPQQSSELETTSFCSSEEDSGGRFSQSTENSSCSPRLVRRQRRKHRKPKNQRMERSVSLSSVTDSTMSLNIITVTLNMDKYNFLGISIVGQSNDRGDGGIYIGSIMKGGAVAADGRIEPGDMLLQVNNVNFENMSNDDAVKVLRDVVHQPGDVTLTVAKCWDPSPRSCFTLPRSEPVRPIDPAAWVSHTAAMTGRLLPHYDDQEDKRLSIHSDITAVVKALANPESGVEVRDRMWLKITIPNAFIGSDVVDWLQRNVEGFTDRRDARKYAENLLKGGYIRHTVRKVTFSEQCYYVFGEICAELGLLSVVDHEEESEEDQWSPAVLQHSPVPHPYSSHHMLSQLPTWTGEGGGEGERSQHGSCSSGSNCSDGLKEGGGREGGGGDRLGETAANMSDHQALASITSRHSNKDSTASTSAPSRSHGQDLSSSSRQSVNNVTSGNPGDYFVDVM